MARYQQYETEGGVRYCYDNELGIRVPLEKCGANRRTRGPRKRPSMFRNFSASEYVEGVKANPVPALVGAAALGTGGFFLAKKVKIGFFGKYNTHAMVVAGVLIGAAVGVMYAKKNTTVVEEEITVTE